MGRCADAEPPASKQAKLASLLSTGIPRNTYTPGHTILCVQYCDQPCALSLTE